jgi:uncharacterized protein (TIGR03000 family)
MTSRWFPVLPAAALAGLLLSSGPAAAGFLGFGNGIGSAMYYGPYTGGHGYSYNVAYSYGLAFSSADTWRRDPLAYPAGVYPYPVGPYPPRTFFFPTAAPAYHATVVPTPVVAPGEVPALAPVPAAAPATVLVSVPAGAELWFDGQKTAQTGPERTFRSPPLPPGKAYVYTVRARWTEGGKPREQIQPVSLQPGGTARLTFPLAGP